MLHIKNHKYKRTQNYNLKVHIIKFKIISKMTNFTISANDLSHLLSLCNNADIFSIKMLRLWKMGSCIIKEMGKLKEIYIPVELKLKEKELKKNWKQNWINATLN